MKIRTDVAEMLRAGHSDRAIAAALHVDAAKTVRVTRRALGLPKARPGKTAATSLEAAFRAHSAPTRDGHMKWAGSLRGGIAAFRWNGRQYTACRAAFEVRYGRPPIGNALPGCGVRRCIAPDHVEDRPMRDTLNTTFNAIFGGAR
ncbi:hypothetical protein ACH44C_34475 [Streptomyces purpureus]|uniref:hypothetical protein n=1 Tax=Streptomyces purpureus TaxID=1951 RepID=UPI0037A663AE